MQTLLIDFLQWCCLDCGRIRSLIILPLSLSILYLGADVVGLCILSTALRTPFSTAFFKQFLSIQFWLRDLWAPWVSIWHVLFILLEWKIARKSLCCDGDTRVTQGRCDAAKIPSFILFPPKNLPLHRRDAASLISTVLTPRIKIHQRYARPKQAF